MINLTMELQLIPQKTTRALAVIDLAIEGSQSLVNSLDPTTAVVVLDSKHNGVEQITTALSNCAMVETLQIIAPYCPGAIRLGTIWLDRSGLETHVHQLQAWQQSFTPETTILLYGSKVVMGIEGMAFVGRLSQLTGVLVVVSHTPTNTMALDHF
jgi:hypothetical protein